MMKEWEYITVKVPIIGRVTRRIDQDAMDRLLSEFGKTGWEYADTISYTTSGTSKQIIIIFKREKNKMYV